MLPLVKVGSVTPTEFHMVLLHFPSNVSNRKKKAKSRKRGESNKEENRKEGKEKKRR
jgi:hypothetical protein